MADRLKKEFVNPGKDYRSAPFWSWNSLMEPDEVRRQVRDMKAHGMGGFFMHSRVGLETPYMGPEWMENIKAAVDEAKTLGMNAWLYDEDRWPSGFAGGLFDHKGFECHHKKLVMRPHQGGYTPGDAKPLRVFALKLDGKTLLGARKLDPAQPAAPEPGETILSFTMEESLPDGWHNGKHYGDNLSAESVKAFIESTYKPYAEQLKEYIPDIVPGIFTDEPNVRTGGWEPGGEQAIPWTTVFVDEFRRRRACDILDGLPYFFFEGQWSVKIRHDYWRTVTELFSENFSKQLGEYSASQGLAWTGHFNQEGSLLIQMHEAGAVMPNYVYQGAPGIDILTEQCSEFLTPKQTSSVAHQFGRKWVLSELYGCTGWEFTFEGIKWVGDWQYALGVTLRCPHLTLYSLKGCAKRDYPPSFNYNNTWWKYNEVHEDYFARLGLMLTTGEIVRDILVVHPIASAWCEYDYDRFNAERVHEWNNRLESVQHALLGLHRDYDFGDEMIMETHACVQDGKLFVELAGYKLVVLPPMKTISSSTVNLLEEFLGQGGKVVAVKPLPELVDSRPTEIINDLWKHPNVRVVPCAADLDRALDEALPARVHVRGATGAETECMLTQFRTDGARRILFICNTDRSGGHQVEVALAEAGEVEEWDLLSGEVRPVASRADASQTVWKANIGPAGSKLYVLDTSKPRAVEVIQDSLLEYGSRNTWEMDFTPDLSKDLRHAQTIYMGPVWDFKRTDPNALTLDLCRWRVRGSALSRPMQVWKAQAQVRAKLGLRPNLNNSDAQRWTWVHDPKDIGPAPTEYHFEFRVDDVPAGKVFLVLEGSRRFTITLNGKKFPAKKSGWYLDRNMHKVALPKLKGGLNRLVLSCDTVDVMQVEDCFLIGDFGVDVKTRAITREPETLHSGDWTLQGYMNYPGGMVYRKTVKVERKPSRAFLFLRKFNATVVAVRINGKPAGFIPWRAADGLDVTKHLKAGSNRVEIEVMGSPKNMLGPLHNAQGKTAWTGSGEFLRDDFRYTPDYVLWPWGLMDQARIEAYRKA